MRTALIEHNVMEAGNQARGTAASGEILGRAADASAAAMLLIDAAQAARPVVYANPAYEMLSGFAAAELTGGAWPLLETAADAAVEPLKTALARAEAFQAQLVDRRKDGSAWRCSVSVEPLYDAQGVLKYFLCLQQPSADGPGTEAVDEARDADGEAARGARVNFGAAAAPKDVAANPRNADPPADDETLRLRKLAAADRRLDPATGLLRFNDFAQLLQRDLQMARRDVRPVAVLVIEIVDFDVYRRTFGGKAADSCQRMIGAQISRALRRAGDLCARYDEATLVASTVGQEPEDLKSLAQQIGEHVRRLGLHNPRGRGRYLAVRTAIVGCPPGTVADAAGIVAQGRVALPLAGDVVGIARLEL